MRVLIFVNCSLCGRGEREVYVGLDSGWLLYCLSDVTYSFSQQTRKQWTWL